MVRARHALLGSWALTLLDVCALIATWSLPVASADDSDLVYVAVMDLLGLLSLVLGLVVATRRPANVVAPLISACGFVPCLITLMDVYGEVHARAPGRFPLSGYLIAFGEGAWMLWYLPAALLMLYFPDGRLLGRRWRLVVAGLLADVVAFSVLAAFTPGPFDPPLEHDANPLPVPTGFALRLVDVGGMVCLLALLPLLVLCLVAAVSRYRRAVGIERAQVKWFLLGAGALPTTLLLCWASYLILGNEVLVAVGLFLVLVTIPAATTIGLLRHDLYDVDRALSTAATYAVVTTALLAVFTVGSFLGGLALGHRSPVVAAAATAVCAAALAPLRTRLRARVDRRLYPARRRALEAIDQLRAHIHNGTGRPEQLAEVLGSALGDPSLRVGYRIPGSAIDVDVTGRPVPSDGVPVLLAGERVGVLVAATDQPRALLREIAQACALLFEVVRLRASLGTALRDVESSRNRLLQAGYDERRRLERDLHDGAQQRLVALGMNLRLAQRHLGDGTVDVDALLDDSVSDLAAAVAELRHIAHGLRPSSLDDGLGPALTTLLSRLPFPVHMQISHGALSDELATTAFFVASEAVTNAIKHAEANEIAVAVEQSDRRLVVCVRDDGNGRAVVRTGAGLSGLGDRVAAAGGALRVDSRPGLGTTVEATLPCAS